MKTKVIWIMVLGIIVSLGLGFLISCDEEKSVNSNPVACLQITSFQPALTLKSVKAGQSYTFSREIKNSGPSDAKEITLGYFLSSDDKITSSDTPLNIEDKLDLSSGENNTRNIDIKIPSTVAPGTKCYVGVIVTSSSCSNNCPEFKSYELTIADAPSENSSCLSIVKWQKLYHPEDNTVNGNEEVTFYGEIRNDGPAVNSNLKISFYFSTDSTITTSDTLLGTLEDPREIPVGSSENFATNLIIPDNLEHGGWYYIGMMITSSNYENTCSPVTSYMVVFEPYPYKISYWFKSNPDQSIYRGETIMFRREIQNTGTTACNTVRIGYYLSTDANITTGDIYMGEETINLQVHEINNGEVALTFPFSLTGQVFYMGILIVSSSCSNEPNPSKSFKILVHSESPLWGIIDYGAGSTQPTDVTCGNNYIFRRIVKNYSSRDCNATLRYYLSTDCTFTAGDTYLGVEETITVPANGQTEGTIGLPIPGGLTPDMYHISALITSTQCGDPQPPVGWDITVTCPSSSNPLGKISPDKKLKASCH